MDTVLENGDTVEILTFKNGRPSPSQDWLSFAKSAKARNKIRQWFAKERREESIEAGHEDDIPDVMSKLRVIYKNLMKLDYDNKRTRHQAELNGMEDIEHKSPNELFSEFYYQQNGVEMTEEQAQYINNMIENIWEEQL